MRDGGDTTFGLTGGGKTGRFGDRRGFSVVLGSWRLDESLLLICGLLLGIGGGSFAKAPGVSVPRGLSALGVTGAGEGDRVRIVPPACDSVGFVIFSNLASSEETGLMDELSVPSLAGGSMMAVDRGAVFDVETRV